MENTAINTRRNLNTIDVFKFICAFLVVGIHTEPFAQYGMLDNAFGMFTRIPVPFFFVASSYFFFKRDVTKKMLWKYVKRILILYLFYSFVYALVDIICGEFIFSDFLFSFFLTGYKHLWYLHSSIIAIIVLYFVSRNKICLKISAVITALAYVLGLLLFSYNPLVKDVEFFNNVLNSSFVKIFYERSWLFYALPFMMIGYFISKSNPIKLKIALPSAIVSFCMVAFEGVVFILKLGTQSTILWLFTLPLLYFLFNSLLNIEVFSKSDTRWCRSLSTSIYCIHPLFIRVFGGLSISNNLIVFVLVSFASFVCALVLFMLSKNDKMKILRYIQ